MLKTIEEQYHGKFAFDHVRQLEKMENDVLHYNLFSSEKALQLGTEIVNQAKAYGEDIAVCIIRKKDNLKIFQYVGDSLSNRNLEFARKKYNTSDKTGHCSLWALAQKETVGGVNEIFSEDSDCLPVGGAFPIFERNELVAILTTSGLHNGYDHECVVKALCALQEKSMPEYVGPLV